MSRPKKRPTLHVVFDTNAIFTSSVRELMNPAASELIRQNSRHADLEVNWWVPEIVRKEREYQMREAAEKLLNAVGKLEDLVRMNWGVNAEWISRAVPTAVDTQFDELKVKLRQLDADLVNWKALIDASVLRLPPFEKGEKEKGFRDAIVCETFLQLVQSLGTREQAVLVTGDALLTEAVKGRIQGNANAKLVSDLDGLQGTLNIMLSQVPATFAQELVAKAATMFYVKGQRDSIFYAHKIDETIKSRFPDPFSTVPEGAERISVEKVVLHSTNFERKEAQRVFFINRLVYRLKATRIEQPDEANKDLLGLAQVKDSSLLTPLLNVQAVATRVASFDVHWSATLTQSGKLQRESIDNYHLSSVVDTPEDDFV